jgi:hypothetical protein
MLRHLELFFSAPGRMQVATPHSPRLLEGCFQKDLLSTFRIGLKTSWGGQKNGGDAIRRSKMEKYRLVEEHKGEGEDFLEQTSESEVRITQQGKPRNYISYAMNLFVSGRIPT